MSIVISNLSGQSMGGLSRGRLYSGIVTIDSSLPKGGIIP